jgi:hypothetical protein
MAQGLPHQRLALGLRDIWTLQPHGRLCGFVRLEKQSMSTLLRAVIREKLSALDWLHRQLERIRRARHEYHFIYPVKGHGSRDLWYLIRAGWVAAAVPKPGSA